MASMMTNITSMNNQVYRFEEGSQAVICKVVMSVVTIIDHVSRLPWPQKIIFLLWSLDLPFVYNQTSINLQLAWNHVNIVRCFKEWVNSTNHTMSVRNYSYFHSPID